MASAASVSRPRLLPDRPRPLPSDGVANGGDGGSAAGRETHRSRRALCAGRRGGPMTAKMAQQSGWRSAAWASSLNLGVGLLGALVFRSEPQLPLWAMLQFSAVGGLTLIVLLAWRRAPRRACFLFFSLDVASALVTALAGANTLARAGHEGQLFQAIQASLMVIAILSPSARLGGAWIAVFTLAPWILIYSWPETIRRSIPSLDLWFVPIYAVVAIALLVYRRRSLRVERALSDARAERLALERLARVTLAVRDLASTPLQTLTTGLALLRHNVRGEEQVLSSMERA